MVMVFGRPGKAVSANSGSGRCVVGQRLDAGRTQCHALRKVGRSPFPK